MRSTDVHVTMSVNMFHMISHLKHEAASGLVAEDGGGELQPEQDGEARREQPAQVEVLPALGHHGRAREARERNGSPHERCHQDAANTSRETGGKNYCRQYTGKCKISWR